MEFLLKGKVRDYWEVSIRGWTDRCVFSAPLNGGSLDEWVTKLSHV